MKKPVYSSHLALRFYKQDGWTRACLEKYLIRGRLLDTEVTHKDSPETAYFSLDVGGALAVYELFDHEISTVNRWYQGPPKETDMQYLEGMQW